MLQPDPVAPTPSKIIQTDTPFAVKTFLDQIQRAVHGSDTNSAVTAQPSTEPTPSRPTRRKPRKSVSFKSSPIFLETNENEAPKQEKQPHSSAAITANQVAKKLLRTTQTPDLQRIRDRLNGLRHANSSAIRSPLVPSDTPSLRRTDPGMGGEGNSVTTPARRLLNYEGVVSHEASMDLGEPDWLNEESIMLVDADESIALID
jgi:hypothetical protein